MCKQEFLMQLRDGLSGLPQSEIEERINFYNEMIEDHMEDGLSEAEAVSAAGSVEEIVSQAIAETPLTKIEQETVKPARRLAVWEVILIILGSPIWLSLLVAAFAVLISLYAVLWSLIAAIWAAFAAVAGCALSGIAAGIVCICGGNAPAGVVFISAGAVCAGVSILFFYGCREATKGIWVLTKKILLWIKRCFIKRRNRNA